MRNDYIPFSSEILAVIPHTAIEFTFRMAYTGDVKPGQFFQVSMPKYGEAPISVSGIGDSFIDLTIRRVGKVTDEVFAHYVGQSLFLRGPYGNGFDVSDYENHEVVVVAGGTGLSPVRGVVEHFAKNPDKRENMTLIVGFKSLEDVLFAQDLEDWKQSMNVVMTVDKDETGTAPNVGFVTQYIPKLQPKSLANTVAVVVGPPAMMKFSALELVKLGIPEENIWISQERKMCCGLGKCGHCKIGNSYVCLDGPVYPYTVGKNLLD